MMKKIKTIVYALMFSLTFFSCQTDSYFADLEELTGLSKDNINLHENSRVNDPSKTIVLLDFNNALSEYQILMFKGYYGTYFGLQQDYICDKYEKIYKWEINSVTERQFWRLVDNMNDPPTGVSDDNEGGIGTIGDLVVFEYDSDCP